MIRNFGSFIVRTNATVPLCSQCIYFEPNPNHPDMSQCVRYGLRDLKSGVISYPLVKDIQQNDRFCGSKGKWFEPKINTDRIVDC